MENIWKMYSAELRSHLDPRGYRVEAMVLVPECKFSGRMCLSLDFWMLVHTSFYSLPQPKLSYPKQTLSS